MSDERRVRRAEPTDALEVAHLLHDFNVEFDTPTPPAATLAERLTSLLAAESTVALLAGSPAVGVALITLRPNVWYGGPVALLDELYVRPDRRNDGLGGLLIEELLALARERGVGLIEVNVDEPDTDAQRFYQRHGFTMLEPDTGERAFYLHRELAGPA